MGYPRAQRTMRRAVARARAACVAGRLVFRPWVQEPGMWVQEDFGQRPVVGGTGTVMLCLWLAWSRSRVVLPLLDRAALTVFAAVDVALRRADGVPTYLLPDNEKKVTVEHVARVPVRNSAAVAFGRHFGLAVATYLPADPRTNGGSEATVRITKTDLVPTETNLRAGYGSFSELEAACELFCAPVSARPHRVTRRPPAQMLAEERARLHPLPVRLFITLLVAARRVRSTTALASFGGGQYSVHHPLAGRVVRVGRHGERVVVTHLGDGVPVEVARHQASTTGSPALDETYFSPAPAGTDAHSPRPRSAGEAELGALGNGARPWLVEAPASGTSRTRVKMAEAVTLASLHGTGAFDRALGVAATAGRFAGSDLAAILTHQAIAAPGGMSRAGESRTPAQGTAGRNAVSNGRDQ